MRIHVPPDDQSPRPPNVLGHRSGSHPVQTAWETRTDSCDSFTGFKGSSGCSCRLLPNAQTLRKVSRSEIKSCQQSFFIAERNFAWTDSAVIINAFKTFCASHVIALQLSRLGGKAVHRVCPSLRYLSSSPWRIRAAWALFTLDFMTPRRNSEATANLRIPAVLHFSAWILCRSIPFHPLHFHRIAASEAKYLLKSLSALSLLMVTANCALVVRTVSQRAVKTSRTQIALNTTATAMDFGRRLLDCCSKMVLVEKSQEKNGNGNQQCLGFQRHAFFSQDHPAQYISNPRKRMGLVLFQCASSLSQL